MLQHGTYLLIDFFTVIVCFIASFDRRIQFYKHFKAFILACTVELPYLLLGIFGLQKWVSGGSI